MTDDISKVVRRFRGAGELERTGYIPAGSAAEREYTATPAEVEMPSEALIGVIADELYRIGEGYSEPVAISVAVVVNRHITTLARQLAYSEEANANLKTMCAAADARAEQAESALAAATQRVAEVEEVLRQIDAYHGPIRTPIHTITKLRGMARAALQKEPK